MGKLTLGSIKMLYRDKQALLYALLFPVIFAVVFGLFDFGSAPEVRVAVVAPQRSEVSETLAAGFRRVEGFEVVVRAEEAPAVAELRDGERDAVVVVPPAPGASGTTTVRLLYNGTQLTTNGPALAAIDQVVGSLNLRMTGVTPPIELDRRPVQARTVRYYDFLLPGLVAMGVMNFSIFGMAIGVARYREQRILKRILATPLAPAKFLAAQVVARLLLAMVQALVILGVGVFVFGANVYGRVLWIVLLAAVANLIFLNIGFAIAGRASNPDAAQGVANVVALPMMFLSGVFFPVETLPSVIRAVVEFLPLTPLIEALRLVANEGASITATGSQVLQLVAWIGISFFMASRMFRFSEAR